MSSTYTPISTTTVTSAISSVTFTSIPQTYTDLVIVISATDGTPGTSFSNIQFRFNSDTGTNYSWTEMYGNGTSGTSHRGTSTTGGWGGYMSSIASIFSAHTLNVMNYSNSSIFKTTIARNNFGALSSSTNRVTGANVSLWRNTNAITSITLNGAISFASGTTLSLYGIKAE